MRARELGPGDLVAGRYRLERELGRGGMSRVLLAHDERLERRVALKVVDTQEIGVSAADRARSEALITASLDDPRLATVHDAVTDGDLTVIVMRWIEGDDLSTLVAAGPLDAARVASLGADVAGALAVVHAAGIVHRDLKPSNIVVTPQRAVLVDFGIARASSTPALTSTGEVIGTAAYLSPEQVRGGAVGPAADVYALGLVVLEALTGEREYTGSPAEAALARLSRQPIVPASLGAAWRDLLERMTAVVPGARPAADEVATRLAAIAADAAEPADAPTAADATVPLVAAAADAADGDGGADATAAMHAPTLLLPSGDLAAAAPTALLPTAATDVLDPVAAPPAYSGETAAAGAASAAGVRLRLPGLTRRRALVTAGGLVVLAGVIVGGVALASHPAADSTVDTVQHPAPASSSATPSPSTTATAPVTTAVQPAAPTAPAGPAGGAGKGAGHDNGHGKGHDKKP